MHTHTHVSASLIVVYQCEMLQLVITIFVLFLPMFLFQGRQPVTPYWFVCPGVNETTKPLVKVGVMLSMPPDEKIIAAGINVSSYTDQLIPGELLVPTSYIAIAALRQAVIINEEGTVLPDHHLCLYYTFVPSDLQDATLGSNFIYTHSRTYQVINALTNSYQFEINRNLMVSFGNMINIRPPARLKFQCPLTANAFNILYTKGAELVYDEQCKSGVFDTNIRIQSSSINLLKAAKLLIQKLGWKRYGILTSCTSQEVWQHEQRGIFLSQYDGNFEESFEVFQENEINIILLVGTVCSYFDFFIQAYDYKVSTSEKFVFLLVIQDYLPVRHMAKFFKRLCNKNYTTEEVYRIKASLHNAIIINPMCMGAFDSLDGISDSYLSLYDKCAQGFTADAISISAIAANGALKVKANATETEKSSLIIDKVDYLTVTEKLESTSFIGRTGLLEFDKSCHRVANLFVASNFFVPEDEMRTLSFKNCRLDYRSYIHTRRVGGVVAFAHNLSFPIESMANTFVFKDNTTHIPPDSNERFYHRSNVRVLVVIMSISLSYFTITLTYIMGVLYYQDKNALNYSEEWLIKQKEVNYSIAHLGALWQSWEDKSITSSTSTIGLYNLNLVHIHKYDKLSVKSVSMKMRKEILNIIELSHKNLCPFYGCIRNGDDIKGIMYGCAVRGNLHDLLINPNFEFNETFRTSFYLDAVHGLQFLHNHKVVHCRLNSMNCMINEHWTLKLTNFGLETLHSFILNDLQFDDAWKAPECRLLGAPPTKHSDKYSLGVLMKEIACRQSLLLSLHEPTDSRLVYDANLPSIYRHLIEACMCLIPADRVSLETVKAGIKCVSLQHKILKTENFGALEMYSSNLEKKLEETLIELECEKEQADTILANYIPKTVVSSLRGGKTAPIREYTKGVLTYIKINNLEKLIGMCENDVTSGIISTVDKTISNICKAHGLERVQCTGSIWVYLGGVYNNTKMSPILNTINTAFEIIQEFEDDNPDEITISIVLHCGPLVCGMVAETNPIHIVAGDTFHYGLLILSLGFPEKIVLSKDFKDKLDFFSTVDKNYLVKQCKPITLKGKLFEAYSLAQTRSSSNCSLKPLTKKMSLGESLKDVLRNIDS